MYPGPPTVPISRNCRARGRDTLGSPHFTLLSLSLSLLSFFPTFSFFLFSSSFFLAFLIPNYKSVSWWVCGLFMVVREIEPYRQKIMKKKRQQLTNNSSLSLSFFKYDQPYHFNISSFRFSIIIINS